jgi:hypothetical protein
MTGELRYLLKTHSDQEACSDQESLGDLLADLHEMADDLDLDFVGAYQEAECRHHSESVTGFDPCI